MALAVVFQGCVRWAAGVATDARLFDGRVEGLDAVVPIERAGGGGPFWAAWSAPVIQGSFVRFAAGGGGTVDVAGLSRGGAGPLL